MAARAAKEFDDFSARREAVEDRTGDLFVLTFDGRGTPMRREHLHPETRAVAQATPRRLHTWLIKGEKRHRKRMAQVTAIYMVASCMRTVADVMADLRQVRDAERDRNRPRLSNKRVWASLTRAPKAVIRDAFEQARRCDPDFKRTWVVLVDGNRDQMKLAKKAPRKLGVAITVVVDLSCLAPSHRRPRIPAPPDDQARFGSRASAPCAVAPTQATNFVVRRMRMSAIALPG
jgi:hypothetical protein